MSIMKVTCIAACQNTYYTNTVTSSANYPNKGSYIHTNDSCVIARKLATSTCRDSRREPLEERYPNICSYLLHLQSQPGFCQA